MSAHYLAKGRSAGFRSSGTSATIREVAVEVAHAVNERHDLVFQLRRRRSEPDRVDAARVARELDQIAALVDPAEDE